jgi:hypothetical protein
MKQLLLACLLLAGCGSLNAQYVQADRKLFDSIAAEYSSVYVESLPPPDLDAEQRETRARTLRLWQARLVEAEAALTERN